MDEQEKAKQSAKNIGVASPYALATVVKNQKINWSRVANPRKLLEDTLGMPYEELFDPKYNSPLFPGTKSAQKINVGDNVVWVDPGSFFDNTGCDVTDPIQGYLGDCYLIAALSSVAWARPYVIAERMFRNVDMIEFFQTTGGNPIPIQISQLLPLSTPGNNYIYARSSNTGEIWPALYEKAYAKWRTNDPGDKPNYAPIAGGDPVAALVQLTGLPSTYVWNPGKSGHDCYTTVQANSINHKTFNPMVAFTYSEPPYPPGVDYNNAHLCAQHAYSILGWELFNNQEYIILRNPWGTYEGVMNVLPGQFDWVSWDQPYNGFPGAGGHWRPIHMATTDGIFGLRSDTFQQYFAGFGWIKTPYGVPS
jgi:hypothetical protein